MTKDYRRVDAASVQEVLLDDSGFLREICERVVQQILEAEMTELVGAVPYERTEKRTGQRNGYKPRALRTRVGTLNLLVPQDRGGTFSTRLFSRYQRNEKALVLALMGMYVEGISTRKVSWRQLYTITHTVSEDALSTANPIQPSSSKMPTISPATTLNCTRKALS